MKLIYSSLVIHPNLGLLPSLRQTRQWHIALREFEKIRTLSELFPVEEQSIWILVNLMSE
jgi:hypothetical protein